jgi:hypothetical protein
LSSGGRRKLESVSHFDWSKGFPPLSSS